MQPFMQVVRDALVAAGFDRAEEASHTAESDHFGDAEAIFRLGSLLLRFVRDRLQVFVDLGSVTSPTTFHQFDDVEIAMGWKTIDEVLAKREPDDLVAVLTRIHDYAANLESAFSDDQVRLTRARIERAARDRGEKFVSQLRTKA